MLLKKKYKMRKSSLLLLLALIFNTAIYAGDNSQATLGDMKEALYKLIMMQKESKGTSSQINERVKDIELSSKQILELKKKDKDKYDLFIGAYVQDYKEILAQIEKK